MIQDAIRDIINDLNSMMIHLQAVCDIAGRVKDASLVESGFKDKSYDKERNFYNSDNNIKSSDRERLSENNMPLKNDGKSSSISLEDIRRILEKKAREGKMQKIKVIVMKYGAGKIMDIEPDDYQRFINEVNQI